jgi:predicted methyltransferase
MHKLIVLLVALTLTACDKAPSEGSDSATIETSDNRLTAVLATQPDTVKARYKYRHPQGTLEFIGVAPGMVVVEVLPGGGWYSKILLPFLGKDGQLIGADYALDMYPKFNFYDDEYLAAKNTWISDWTAEAESWRDDDSASVSAFVLGSMSKQLAGTADAVLFIRALHNLNRFEDDGGYLTAALDDAYQALKPGGIVGVVQHRSSSQMPDEWANGSNGYLKERFLISRMEAAGFEFLAGSGVNANDRDQPSEEDFVWRLPPTLAGSNDDPERRAAMEAIGESNRMTLKFQKPL